MKIFKKHNLIISSLLIILLLSFSSCFGPYIEGNGNVVERNRNVSDFHKIDISGGFKVYVSVANKESLKIIADENLHEHIETRVVNNRLKIENTINIRRAKKREIYIELRSIDNISLSGAVEFKGKTLLKAETLTIDASGAVEIILDVRAEKIICELSGACDVYLSGRADKVYVEATGGVELEAFELVTDRFNLTITGAGSATVHAREKLDVKISGAARVKYKGNPDVRKNITGAASLKKY